MKHAEALQWLLKPLYLEQEHDFQNLTIAGGLDKWLQRIGNSLVKQAQLAPAEADKLVAILNGYNAATIAERRKKIQRALAVVQPPVAIPVRRARPEKSATGKTPARPVSAPKAGVQVTGTVSLAENEVQYLKGVGPYRAQLLAKLGVATLPQLVRFYPRDWQDRRALAAIGKLTAGAIATVCGQVRAKQTFVVRHGLKISKVMLEDSTGLVAATWFNQPYMLDRFEAGQRVVLHGKIEFYRGWQIMNPEFEILEDETEDSIHTGRIVPVYPLTEGLSQRVLRSLLYQLQPEISRLAEELLPPEIRQSFGFLTAEQALRNIHFPESFEALAAARERLVYEELFLQQLAIARTRQHYRHQTSQALKPNGPRVAAFMAALPFTLTPAQNRALEVIGNDLNNNRPMHRLLQGDVGSGKTIVAALAMLTAVDNQMQAALMAPTEVLATQHYFQLRRLFEPLGVGIALFVSGQTVAVRRKQHAALASGEIQMAVGTHALTQELVEFNQLGVVVIDEQHRFGVEQRARLRAKGKEPHVLVMTATPIPRTLAMTVYGDLDVTVLDELPPGRTPIQTRCFTRRTSATAYANVGKAVAKGQQAYIVFPLIEESDKLDLRALNAEYERLSNLVFRGRSLGLLHGRLDSQAKERVMAEFKNGTIQILAATTVVEVGIDIPNASVIVIEDADRFGLASLHQLRGRVGRGKHASFCYLIADPKTQEGKARLQIMTKISDGFQLAEEDLAMRGPGEFFGVRQHGLPDLKLADLVKDVAKIAVVRKWAEDILTQDPELSNHSHAGLKKCFEEKYANYEKRVLAG